LANLVFWLRCRIPERYNGLLRLLIELNSFQGAVYVGLRSKFTGVVLEVVRFWRFLEQLER
jgi:hypothetical protein